MIKLRTAAAMATGAMGMYFLDPTLGRRRRAVTVDKLRSEAAKRRRRMQQREVYEEKRERGERMRRAGAGRFRRRDDRSVADHLRQVLEGLPLPTADVTVEVLDDRVRVRGQVDSADHMSTLLAAVGSECGDRQVESYLHLPGEPAPNKEPALRADDRGRHISAQQGEWASRPFAPT